MRDASSSARRRTVVVAIGVLLAIPLLPGFRSPIRAGEDAASLLTPDLARQVVEEVVPEVERLRGLPFKRPVPVHVIADAEARAYVLRRLETFDQLKRFAVWQRVYEQLGLLEEGTDVIEVMLAALEQQVAGYYDPGDGSFYLLDDQPAASAAILTAHELAHALEDQHFDLDGRLSAVLDDEDRLLAMSAVHEGSATLLMMIYMMQNPGDAGASAAAGLGNTDSQIASLEALPTVLLRQLIAPYVLGLNFIIEGNFLLLGHGFPVDRVARLFEDAPSSSEQILHPEKYWSEEARDEPLIVALDGAADPLGDGWRRLGEGTLGELTLGVLVGAPTPAPAAVSAGAFDPRGWTNEAASGWCGDRWELWRSGEETVLLWLTRWDSVEDAREFAAALPQDGSLRAKRKGSAVAVVVGVEGRRSSRLLKSLLAGRTGPGCTAPSKPVK